MNTTNELKTKHQQMLELLDGIADSGKSLGIILQTIEDEQLDGRTVHVKGKKLLNFTSCSYLGLELDSRLIAGAIDATTRYGTQFASTRAYLSVTLYKEIEEQLSTMFGMPVALAQTTGLGHISNIPILVGDRDAVIMDIAVHATVQEAVSLLVERGVTIERVRHNRMDLLEDRVKELSKTHDKIWYMADGVYSMFGDGAPLDEIKQLLDTYEQMYLYIDDAHGMSWAGEHGAGYVNSKLKYHPKMYLTTSLAKGFGATGGVLAFPNDSTYKRVHDYGRTFIFSTQLPPPMLGAIRASARIHLSDEINLMQSQLVERIKFFNQTAKLFDIPLLTETITPVRFIPLGKPEVGYGMVTRMMNAGFYTSLSVFPSVSYNNTGMRVAINRHHTMEDIENIVREIAAHLPAVLSECGSSYKEVQRFFKMTN
ncbi:aminotransferase class I/II-fold pyridoxal phosphate-dependent enzyme [soil metagenome]